MAYRCGKCQKEVKVVRLNDEHNAWICDKCYFAKDKSSVIIKGNALYKTNKKTKTSI